MNWMKKVKQAEHRMKISDLLNYSETANRESNYKTNKIPKTVYTGNKGCYGGCKGCY